MTTDQKIKDKKLKYKFNREAAKISALSPGKIDKDEYITGEEISTSPSDKSKIIDQAKFMYSPLGKAFFLIKTIKDQEIKQVEALKA